MIGFTFGIIGFALANRLTKQVKNLQAQIDDLKKRMPPAKD